ncbi:MAG: hypothetical protein II145_06520, partial [Selenomonas sp.]|nr:hypothetical protein [Selenomonas sp.]
NERAKAIYDYLKATGRFIDVAKLNEKQSHVGLKAVLGSLGYQMLESNKLDGDDKKIRVDTLEEFIDLLAYNLSDVVNLGELFNSNVYSSNFKLKKQLLETYPELMYQKKPDAYAPDIAPDKVKTGSSRMYIDSSSSKLAAHALCPYGHLDDIEGVSFLYPSARKAKERGIEQIDVLEEANKFLHANFPEGSEAVKAWNKVYEKYSSFRGKNYNDSKEYVEKWGYHEVHSLKGVHPIPIMYYKADGTPSTCFANFSTGGIHGAECNLPLYYEDLHAWQHKQYVRELFKLRAQHDLAGIGGLGHMPSDQECVTYLAANKITEIADPKDPNIVYSLKEVATYTAKKAKWKVLKQPQLFTETEGKISKRYVYTSVGECEHEDFTSYYPNLLINLEAFYNEQLGYDRYAEIFDLKQKYGKDMKNKELYDELQRKLFSILREGTKLILNSASGAGDQSFYSPIRMNNMIISMRLIGQLFTWRIGQAQTLEGANIASTNTDGLYAFIKSDFFGHNEDVLARESDVIHVEIEPEPMVLISKDANCRGEFTQKFDILTASGGSLGCWEDPKTTKSLSHPALLDRGLLFYMQYMLRHGISFYEEPDKAAIERIVRDIISDDDLDHVLRLAQNIFKSSRGSMNWNFAYKDRALSEDNSKFYTYEDLRILDYYVRGYFVSKDAVLSRRIKGLHIAKANGRTIPDKTLAKRIAANESQRVIDPQCREVMKTVGLYDDIISAGNRDMVIEKVTGADPENFIHFDNRSIYNLTDEEKRHIISCLDVNKYVDEIAKAYKSQWQNTRTVESMELYRAHPTCQAM